MDSPSIDLQASCDRLAEEYAYRFWNETEKKPFDQKMLDWLAEKANGLGIICDLGCGSGQVARYLYSRGAIVCGIDLSSEMVRQAQCLNPDIPFQQGNMIALTEVADGTYGGIVSFYSIVHIPRIAVKRTLRELRRVLCPQGILLLAFYVGQEVIHLDELWGEKVSVDFVLFETEEMKGCLRAAGFELEEVIERDPYPDIEYQGRHAYIFARRPQG